jgi:Tfp pilus assembly protein PilP
MLAALALGLQLGAQGKPAPAVKPGASVATPAQSAEINTDDLLVSNATPYHPTLVRDPFSTPTDAEQTNKGDLVDDIAVKGRVVSNGKTLAVISDARGNVRMLPVGFKFRDGVLVAIDEKSVTFHQWDPSGTNTRIYRTVVKIYKREEAKR